MSLITSTALFILYTIDFIELIVIEYDVKLRVYVYVKICQVNITADAAAPTHNYSIS